MPTNREVKIFASGVHNVANAEIIPKDAAQSASNWVTKDGKNILVEGRKIIGAEGVVGKIRAMHFAYKVDGTKVLYRKTPDKVQYLNGTTWTDVLTGLTDTDISFANYSSLAGTFLYINSVDGYWKICTANPGDALSVYLSTANFHGKIIIDRGRTLLWDRNDTGSRDRTGLYGSHIDAQDSTVYTTVTAEAIGALGSTNYTGTLVFRGSEPYATCFGASFVATVAAGTETFVDDFKGNLTSNLGGTGTINYTTGVYDVTFSDTTTGAVTADYQWENTNLNGITDFSLSATRLAGEGFQFPQDQGGDPILNVEIGQDGRYYSIKKSSAYTLDLDAEDTNATNELYRKELGLPHWKASTSTLAGIVFMNTANPSDPQLTILQRNITDSIEPKALLQHFNFSNYDYSEAYLDTYDRYIIIICKTPSAVNNDTILLCDLILKTVDVSSYSASSAAKDGNNLYIGSSVTESTYQIFDGYDDDGVIIENEWVGRDETYNSEDLKKIKKLRIKGMIDPNQYFEVYLNYDNGGKSLVGTIRGNSSYVDFSDSQTVGSNIVGTAQVGGDAGSVAYHYFAEIKLKQSKFRKRSLSIIAKGIGYVDFDFIMDYGIRTFENRLPKRYRQKQNVDLSGNTNLTVFNWDDSTAEWDGEQPWDFQLNN